MPDAEPRILARGRDCDVYEHGPGQVLRRARDGRSLAGEAAVMRHVAAHGFPVPAVQEDGGPDLVMERIEGPSMFADFARRPWRLRAHAATLADLHQRLHAIPPPDELRGTGSELVHLDLHPLNILMSPRGPVVIDWSNARRDAAAVDVAQTWLILAVSVIPGGPLKRALAGAFRKAFLGSFLSHFDLDEVRAVLPAVAAERERDRNVLPEEVAAMHKLVAQ